MTPRQQFKYGFLSSLVKQGASLSQIEQQIDKLLEKRAVLDSLTSLAKPVISSISNVGIPMALAAPPILGGVAGLTASKLTDVDDTDVDEIKQQEIINALRRNTTRLQQATQARRDRQLLS